MPHLDRRRDGVQDGCWGMSSDGGCACLFIFIENQFFFLVAFCLIVEELIGLTCVGIHDLLHQVTCKGIFL